MRWTALGALIALWFAVLAGPPTMPRAGGRYYHSAPRLAHPMADDYDGPYDQIEMLKGSRVELAEGYRKRAFAYVGNQAVLTTFDTGSFRNAIQAEFLEECEKKQNSFFKS